MRPWQEQAWTYYDTVGELRYAAQWISNALSRCRLYVGVAPDDPAASSPKPLTDLDGADERAHIPLNELFGGPSGHPEMLARLGLHLTVPGESYMIGFDDIETRERRWIVASSEEFTRNSAKQFRVRLPESDKQIPIDVDNSTVIRLWRPHPRRAWEADSPVRAALGVLKELVDLTAHITATVESRLAGAGVWLLPESATLPSPLNSGGEPLHSDPAMSTLIDAMITPLGDRDSCASVVPIIVRVPDQAVGKSEYIKFWTPLDDKIQELREASIRRFATIVDIPAEVMVGAASETNHWGMWKIEESALKLHVAPMLGLICDSLTQRYLWPALEALGVANPYDHIIWYDDSDLVQRPNRGPESQNLYEMGGLVKGATVRKANGFSDDDAPDAEEQRRILLTRLASSGIDPALVAPYLAALGIEIELPVLPAGDPGGEEDGSTPPGSRIMGRPTLPTRLPTRPEVLPGSPDTADRPSPAAVRLHRTPSFDLAAVEIGALRALELAGKRALNNSNREWKGRLRGVEPWAIHTHIAVVDLDLALEGAYVLFDQCMPEAPCVRRVIDGYVRERLVSQAPHDRAVLVSQLVSAGCLSSGGGSRAIA